jgi:pyruvate dehydrogenase E2 component (dihydrolipoamide acetyltransferase)
MSSRLQTFTLPDVGEGLTEAEILSWHVNVGDMLEVNQIMVEIETAKAAVELPSPHAGRVHRLLAEPGVTIEVGTPIIQIDTQPDAGPLDGDESSGGAGGSDAGAGSGAEPSGGDGASGTGASDGGAKIGEVTADGRVATLVGYIAAESGSGRPARRGAGAAAIPGSVAGGGGGAASTAAPAGADTTGSALESPGDSSAEPAMPAPGTTATSVPATAGIQALATATTSGPDTGAAPLATPPVRKLAKDLGIDLRTVTATRPDGVISRADVESAHAGTSALAGVVTAGATGAPADAGGSAPGRTAVAYDPATRETRVPVKGVRKMTAAAMVSSAFTAPHVTEFLTVDVTPMMNLREKLRGRPEFAEVRLSPLAFAARAVCLAARRTPEANCVWDEGTQQIVYKQYVHLGIAAATPRGLIVPVIRDADQLDLLGLARALGELTATARSGKTPPADMTGGTFTITNVGVFGVDTGTPIINPGESAILALGSIKDAPWVVNGKLKVRKVCQLALSFDHRVIDGQQGSQFLADVGALLADPALAITY